MKSIGSRIECALIDRRVSPGRNPDFSARLFGATVKIRAPFLASMCDLHPPEDIMKAGYYSDTSSYPEQERWIVWQNIEVDIYQDIRYEETLNPYGDLTEERRHDT